MTRTGRTGITWRGRAFLAVGIVLGTTGLITAEEQLLRLAVLALAVPLAGLVLMSATAGGLSVSRSLDRTQVGPGQPAVLTLTVANTGRLPVAGAVLVQPLTTTLVRAGSAGPDTGSDTGSGTGSATPGRRNGSGRSSAGRGRARPAPTVTRRRIGLLRPGARDTATLAVTGTVRGRHDVPPAVLIVADPFGMVRRTRTAAGAETTPGHATVLTVLPVIHRLTGRPVAAPAGAAAIGRGRSLGVAGEQDSAVREYAPGDDVRRVHWRSTAHHGGLMVRQEEQPWQSGLTVLLDTRAAAHAGTGPDSSFELAVSAAASVLDHAARLGYEVRLITSTARSSRYVPGAARADSGARGAGRSGARAAASASGTSGSGRRGTAADRTRMARTAVESLVDVTPVSNGSGAGRIGPPGPAGRAGRAGADALIAILGSLQPEDLAELSELRAGRTATIALLLQIPGWTGNDGSRGDRAPIDRSRADWERTDGTVGPTRAGSGRTPPAVDYRAALAAQGWHTAELARDESPARAWDQARATTTGKQPAGARR